MNSKGSSSSSIKRNNIFFMNEDVDKIEEFDELNIRDSIIVDNDDKEEEKTLEFNNNNNNSNKDVIIKNQDECNSNKNKQQQKLSMQTSNLPETQTKLLPRDEKKENRTIIGTLNSGRKRSKFKANIPTIPKEIFVELKELRSREDDYTDDKIYEWREISRWIKYEEDLDLETGLWNKPFVGPIFYQSLLNLKSGLQYGTVLLTLECDSFDEMIEEIAQDFINSGHMNKEDRDAFKLVLSSDHISTTPNIKKENSQQAIAQLNNSALNVTKIFSLPNDSSATLNKSQLALDLEPNVANDLPSGEHKRMMRRDSSMKFHIQSHTFDHQTNEYSSSHHSTPFKQRRSTMAMINTMKNSVLQLAHNNRSDSNLKGLNESNVESCILMVGVVDFLDRPVMAFVRLNTPHFIENFCEAHVKVRFVFVLLGPKNPKIDYVEIGRCMGTLMTYKDFHNCAYRAQERRELIDCISRFTYKSICVLIPLGDYDRDLLLPIIEWIQKRMQRKRKKLNSELKQKKKDSLKHGKHITRNLKHLNSHGSSMADSSDVRFLNDSIKDHEHDPFERTGCMFGGLINEVKNRYSKYFSDIKDAFDLHCLLAFIFIFTVCLAPALTFGGILADKTHNWFGLNEMLLATSINGVIFGLFSGQPIMILGSTGPFLVFEEMLYLFCKNKFCIEFLPTRIWVAIWILFYTLIMLAVEGVFVIEYVTRFAEEIFAFLIAVVFLTDAFKKAYSFFVEYPILPLKQYCTQFNSHLLYNETKFEFNNFTISNETFYSINDYVTKNQYCLIYSADYMEEMESNLNDSNKHLTFFEPNVALFSLILMVCTCAIALGLKKLRRSKFFGSYARRTLSDVGILIAILTMVGIDYFVEKETGLRVEKLDIPNALIPTKSEVRKNWFVNPLGDLTPMPLWVPFFASLPALLIFIVLFFEVELTGIMLNAPHRKLKKGVGFNLDLLIFALLMTLNAFFGLPWMCAAPVRTLAHWASLCIYNDPHIPGEKPTLVDIKEQRVTNITVHIAIGLCLFATDFLKKLPMSVLFGIFLYFGIVSLSGTQLFERIKLIFKPSKHRPNAAYARSVRPVKRNLFTVIQIIAVCVLLTLKIFVKISFIFPIVLALLVPFRKFILPMCFSEKELEQLDQEKEDLDNSDMIHDFYELTHLPI